MRFALALMLSIAAIYAAAQNAPAGASGARPAQHQITTHQQATPAGAAAESERDWWKNAVIYEIYPRSFQDSNGDGIGDLNGITARLDYLKTLGVDAIWLTPVYPSPQVDFGYDISDYRNIDPQYGTLADFDRLVAEADKRHIRVLMDMVMNHTSDQHQWFLAVALFARQSLPRLVYLARWQGRDGDRAKARRPTTGSRTSATRPGSGTRRRASTTTTSSTSSSPT